MTLNHGYHLILRRLPRINSLFHFAYIYQHHQQGSTRSNSAVTFTFHGSDHNSMWGGKKPREKKKSLIRFNGTLEKKIGIPFLLHLNIWFHNIDCLASILCWYKYPRRYDYCYPLYRSPGAIYGYRSYHSSGANPKRICLLKYRNMYVFPLVLNSSRFL